MTKEVQVIRIGHRIVRDVRVTTHCALTARALGASGITISGEEDPNLIEGLKKTASQWGGSFYITYNPSYRSICSAAKRNGCALVHATMYGQPIQKKIKALQKEKKIAIIVGSQKVPGEIYQLADYNIAVTNQPHSEVAALAIILHEIFSGKELNKKFSNPRISIEPCSRGKKTIKKE
jgi:tRNA (cytidine56-2'-O)-methyltransferase